MIGPSDDPRHILRNLPVNSRPHFFFVIVQQHSVQENRHRSRSGQLLAGVFRRFKSDVVTLPFARLAHRIHQRRPLPVHRPRLPIRISLAPERVQHLNLKKTHQEYAAVPAILTDSADIRRLGPFDVQLNIAELFLRRDIAAPRHHLEVPVSDLPCRRIGAHRVCRCAQPRASPLRQIFAVEQDHGVRRRLSRLCPGGHDLRMRTRRVMHMPRQTRQQRSVGETIGVILSD